MHLSSQTESSAANSALNSPIASSSEDSETLLPRQAAHEFEISLGNTATKHILKTQPLMVLQACGLRYLRGSAIFSTSPENGLAFGRTILKTSVHITDGNKNFIRSFHVFLRIVNTEWVRQQKGLTSDARPGESRQRRHTGRQLDSFDQRGSFTLTRTECLCSAAMEIYYTFMPKLSIVGWVWWLMPVIPAVWEAKAGESLEPSSLKPTWQVAPRGREPALSLIPWLQSAQHQIPSPQFRSSWPERRSCSRHQHMDQWSLRTGNPSPGLRHQLRGSRSQLGSHRQVRQSATGEQGLDFSPWCRRQTPSGRVGRTLSDQESRRPPPEPELQPPPASRAQAAAVATPDPALRPGAHPRGPRDDAAAKSGCGPGGCTTRRPLSPISGLQRAQRRRLRVSEAGGGG
ncbi:hypothetical protein AAY473_008408 [Plecturocebus cupreus]